jgi:poly(beta-D-mannuronate) lyase
MDSAFCVVEYNLFERTEGENEGAICHKSCRNIIRFNTFGERSEECSIRHGNKSQVYGNFFLNTTGLRFSGDDHLIYANYFRNCTKAIVCQNGDGEVKEGSKLTCHDRADRIVITNNAIIDCKISYQMPSRENGYGATAISFTDNLIRGGAPVTVRGPYPGAVWKDNVIWNAEGGDMPVQSYRSADISTEKPEGFNVSASLKYPAIPASIHILNNKDVGPLAI